MKDGEQALMARVGYRKTLAIHLDCAEKQHGTAAWSWRSAMSYWGCEYLISCGYRLTLPPCPSNVANAGYPAAAGGK